MGKMFLSLYMYLIPENYSSGTKEIVPASNGDQVPNYFVENWIVGENKDFLFSFCIEICLCLGMLFLCLTILMVILSLCLISLSPR